MTGTVIAALLGLAVPQGSPPQELPPPRAVPGPAVLVAPAPPLAVDVRKVDFVHPDPLEKWQYLAPDRRGHFSRLRVVHAPDGTPFYLYDGRPYPYGPVFPRDETPWVTGTPYRSH